MIDAPFFCPKKGADSLQKERKKALSKQIKVEEKAQKKAQKEQERLAKAEAKKQQPKDLITAKENNRKEAQERNENGWIGRCVYGDMAKWMKMNQEKLLADKQKKQIKGRIRGEATTSIKHLKDRPMRQCFYKAVDYCIDLQHMIRFSDKAMNNCRYNHQPRCVLYIMDPTNHNPAKGN